MRWAFKGSRAGGRRGISSPASILAQLLDHASSIRAALSRNAAVAPPWMAGGVGTPISDGAKGRDRGQLVSAPVEFDAQHV
ncbi:hypothetical protein, partial [Falsirhodobacter sp. alg1]|uniref:hypothetical protein n=1 Tax=Falsirhodobacter sp. alg1 TaxID=1472418 RepID=UPI001EDC708B